MIKIIKREHQTWSEGAHALIGHKIVGQWQYLYSNDKGQISCVQLYGYPLGEGLDNWDSFQWELYQQKGKQRLIEDVERFDTKEEAEKRIEGLLGEKIKK